MHKAYCIFPITITKHYFLKVSPLLLTVIKSKAFDYGPITSGIYSTEGNKIKLSGYHLNELKVLAYLKIAQGFKGFSSERS